MSFPWLHHLESCNSTNQVALDRIADLNSGDAIFTRKQTAGRGQRNRVWQSPPGVITVSFIVHLTSPTQRSHLSLISGWSILSALDRLLPQLQPFTQLKWPNDILLHDRKVAGILCEMRSSVHDRAVIGIGLNHCANFSQLPKTAPLESLFAPISLQDACPDLPDDLTIVQQLHHSLLQTLDQVADPQQGIPVLLEQIRSRDALIDRHLIFELPNGETLAARACGLSDRGELLLEMPDRSRQAHSNGRIIQIHSRNRNATTSSLP